MNTLELACLAIVAIFLVARGRMDSSPWAFLARMATMSCAAWIGEDTCIRLYGFYAYTPEAWTLWLDVTPVLVPLIWPVVIQSCWDLADRLLGPEHPRVPLATAAFVLADAAFIEPAAVQAGLWHWTEPGLFGVPPVGAVGWACFALVAAAWLRRRPGPLALPGLPIVAPVGCHLLLLALWWGAFRWLNAPVPAAPAVAVVAGLSAALTVGAVRRGLRQRVPVAELMLRAPGAAFFVVLLALEPSAPALLWAWTACFVPPYLALLGGHGATMPPADPEA